jgi:hypothetical protein
MTDNTTLDAAIEAALRAADMSTRPQSIHRKFSKALIAKLLEGMDRHEGFSGFWYDGYRAALDDLQKISGTGSDS